MISPLPVLRLDGRGTQWLHSTKLMTIASMSKSIMASGLTVSNLRNQMLRLPKCEAGMRATPPSPSSAV